MYKLMIVDDEALIRRGIKSLVNLEKLNISELFEASNGEEALLLFKENLPDIVLADINMPKMDGLTFAKAILDIDKNVKVAFITGYDYFDYAQAAIKIGVSDYILKPVSCDDIENVLNNLIEKIKEDSTNKFVRKIVDEYVKDTSDIDTNPQSELLKKLVVEGIYKSDFSLSKLADELGFSKGYLSSLFKKVYGQRFQDYTLNERLERARFILLTSDLKNYEIADKIGFEDVNYFSMRFKKKYGLTPKQYKKIKGDSNE